MSRKRWSLLDGFIEKKFVWGHDPGDKHHVLTPYSVPWVGFVHNPPGIPEWFNSNEQSPGVILQLECWRQSILWCKGLFTLSAYLRDWLKPRVPVLVCSLLHPTEIPENKFRPEKYLRNRERKIVQVGWWLRKFGSLYLLDVRRSQKVLLNLGYAWSDKARRTEFRSSGDPTKRDSVRVLPYLPSHEYDELLSKNIVFLDLYDSSANNAIIECIARATPVLVNALPAVVEYLGPNYPLYFNTLEEAAYKAENDGLVLGAHEYLKSCPTRKKLTRDHFLKSFVGSEIYQRLPIPNGAGPGLPSRAQAKRGLAPGSSEARSGQPTFSTNSVLRYIRRAPRSSAPKVSILTSVFAADQYVAPFMMDIVRQTVFHQCELLLYNIVCSHRNPHLVDKTIAWYMERYPNILCRKLGTDPGLYAIWNAAIRASHGQYITTANLDDRKAPNSLEQHIRELEGRSDIDLVCSAMLVTRKPNETWECNSVFGTYFDGFNRSTRNTSSLDSCEEFGLDDLFVKDGSGRWVDAENLPHCMPMWRRTLHGQFGHFNAKAYGPVADWEFWIRCASGGARFRLLRRPLGLYLEDPGSHNRRCSTEKIKKAIIEAYWRKHNER